MEGGIKQCCDRAVCLPVCLMPLAQQWCMAVVKIGFYAGSRTHWSVWLKRQQSRRWRYFRSVCCAIDARLLELPSVMAYRFTA